MKRTSLFAVVFLSLCALSFASVYKTNVHASYYADKFHGRQTASGEIFNMNDFTCAHKTLPFGTILRVTNLENNRSVNVRVNDRGPFVAGREIDLSKAAARQLDMIRTGTATVRLEIVSNGESTALSNATAAAATGAKSGSTGAAPVVTETPVRASSAVVSETLVKAEPQATKPAFWDVQVGSFESHENANRLAQDLLKAGFENVYFQKTEQVTRVVIKNVSDENLQATEAQLKLHGYANYIVKKNN